MTTIDTLTTELTDLLQARADALGAALGDPAALLTHDWPGRARLLAAHLLDSDSHAAAEAAHTIGELAWPDGIQIATEWWSTPLGRAVGLAGHTTTVPLQRAAALLGVTRQRVQRLVADGRLERGVGGVTVESVRAYAGSRGEG